MMTFKLKDFYSIDEVAELVELGRDTIKREMIKGKIHFIKVGGSYRISQTSLADYLGDAWYPLVKRYKDERRGVKSTG